MKTTSRVARFISERIELTGQRQTDIAKKAGFGMPNIITMIKQGKTRLPVDKIWPMAIALETDPVALLHLCLQEYHPELWKSYAPYLENTVTKDESRLIAALRTSIGAPYLAALSEESRSHFENLTRSLQTQSTVQ
jgi:hypothetical protein